MSIATHYLHYFNLTSKSPLYESSLTTTNSPSLTCCFYDTGTENASHVPLFFTFLNIVQKNYDANGLLIPLCTAMLNSIIPVEASVVAELDSMQMSAVATELLCHLISKLMLSDICLASVIEQILTKAKALIVQPPTENRNKRDKKKQIESTPNPTQANRNVSQVLNCISQRHPSLFDSCIQKVLEDIRSKAGTMAGTEDGEENQSVSDNEIALKQLLGEIFISAPFHQQVISEGTTLFLAFENSSSAVRAHALKCFVSNVPIDTDNASNLSEDIQGLVYSAAKCLVDTNADVLQIAWSSECLSKILLVVSKTHILHAFLSTFHHWFEKSQNSPKKSCRVLTILFESLSDEVFFAGISCTTSEDIDNSDNSHHLLFLCILKCTMQFANTVTNSEQGKEAVALRSLCHATLKATTRLSTHYSLIKGMMIKGVKLLSEKNWKSGAGNDEFSNLSALIVSAVARTLSKSVSQVSAHFLSLVMNALYCSWEDFSGELISSNGIPQLGQLQQFQACVLLSFLRRVADELSTEHPTSSDVLNAVLKLIIVIAIISLTSEEETPGAPNSDKTVRVSQTNQHMPLMIETLNFALSRLSTPHEHAPRDTAKSFSEAVERILSPVSVDDIGALVVTTLMRSNHEQVVSLSGSAIRAFFTHHPHTVLLKISLLSASDVHSGSEQSIPRSIVEGIMQSLICCEGKSSGFQNGHMDIADYGKRHLSFDSHAKACAMAALSVYVRSAATTAESGRLSLEHGSTLVLVYVLAISGCADANASVRHTALDILSACGDLPLHIAIKIYDLNMNTSELKFVGQFLSTRKLEIASDRSVSTALLRKLFSLSADELFTVAQESNISVDFKTVKNECASIRYHILDVCAELGWQCPSLTAPLLQLCFGAHDVLANHWQNSFRALFSAPLDKSNAEQLSTVFSKNSSGCEAMVSSLIRCLESVKLSSACSEVFLTDVVQCLLGIVSFESSSKSDKSSVASVLKEEVISLIGRGWAAVLPPDLRNLLFAALIEEKMAKPGKNNVSKAVTAISVPLTTVVEVLRKYSVTLFENWKSVEQSSTQIRSTRYAGATDDMEEESDSDSVNVFVSGMALPFQRMCSILEATLPLFLQCDGVAHAKQFGQTASCLLDILAMTVHDSLKAVLAIEYTQTIILDVICHCFQVAGSSVFCDTSSSVDTSLGKTPSKAAAKRAAKGNNNGSGGSEMDVTTHALYSRDRIAADVEVVLNCLNNSRSLQVSQTC